MRADVDLVLAGGESPYGERAAFIGADLATPRRIREHHAEGKTVVIVDEHERVRVLPAP